VKGVSATGSEGPKFMDEKPKNLDFETRSARNTNLWGFFLPPSEDLGAYKIAFDVYIVSEPSPRLNKR